MALVVGKQQVRFDLDFADSRGQVDITLKEVTETFQSVQPKDLDRIIGEVSTTISVLDHIIESHYLCA